MNLSLRLKKEEGFSGTVYKCPAGKWTIGYGFNVDPAGGGSLPKQVAHIWLMTLIQECEDDLYSIFGYGFLKTVGRVRVDALCEMRYNLGPAGFREFRNMIAAVKRRDWTQAALECLDSAAASQLPRRYNSIADRLLTGVDLED